MTELDPTAWPYTDDPYRAAWAMAIRYLPYNDQNNPILNAIHKKLDLADVPNWFKTDPVDQVILDEVN
jgi:hypothetical protein